ncbi:ABC transporter permease [Pseudomonas syringae]|uniref:ABC transporter permease n=1 Tax=Pseudomonas syringae TaxID=317 RepID=UPI000414F86F|nr:ABC transporter permease [Pseudomonas syringae]MBI6741765.1 ABC transporter permease [Pseudomonas syringae]MBI6747092.1 ABC transporter permease [Pseudomonas syringae]MBI6759797.1 ABC transporter permease [Pseudomonas syringae]MBI6806571.1 ABC transporter permease [Pseudomonas syringae]MBI6824829.1 ABC transporter permease [Pseudomonas syringae]
MFGFLLRRLGIALCVAITVSVISFSLLHLSGDLATAIGGPEASSEQIEQIRVQYGLNKPLVTQYFEWLADVVRLDLGDSFFFQESVYNLIASRLSITLGLGAMALSIALLIAIPLGVLAAVKRDTWIDRVALSIAVLGQAMPSFWFALMLIVVFSVTLKWLPVSGNSTWAHFVMPAIALGYYATPAIMRLTRAGMLDVLNSDYIRTARAKGLRPATVLFKHALRNALIPVVALAAVEFGFMLGGSVVIETVFSLQGIGQLAWDAIARDDFPVVQAVVLLIAVIYIVLTLLADVLNALLDPRIRVK